MISFPKLGHYGRLGNQLFQYAFIRSTASRLGVQFYCPPWEGDQIFKLNDGNVRASAPVSDSVLFDQRPASGYDERSASLGDNTEVQGYFQSERYFTSRQDVIQWFEFNENIKARNQNILRSQGIHERYSISLRLDDDYKKTQEFFPPVGSAYYKKALERIPEQSGAVIFSDRPDRARDFVTKLGLKDAVFLDELHYHDQLYIMTQCKGCIITNSTFAWWGAYLNDRDGRVIVSPKHWNRPGVPNATADIICADWQAISYLNPVLDHFQVWRIVHPIQTTQRIFRKFHKDKSG